MAMTNIHTQNGSDDLRSSRRWRSADCDLNHLNTTNQDSTEHVAGVVGSSEIVFAPLAATYDSAERDIPLVLMS